MTRLISHYSYQQVPTNQRSILYFHFGIWFLVPVFLDTVENLSKDRREIVGCMISSFTEMGMAHTQHTQKEMDGVYSCWLLLLLSFFSGGGLFLIAPCI